MPENNMGFPDAFQTQYMCQPKCNHTMGPSNNLRWLEQRGRDGMNMPIVNRILQQAWICQGCGIIEWRAIPTVTEEEANRQERSYQL